MIRSTHLPGPILTGPPFPYHVAHAVVKRARLINRIERPHVAPVTLITAPAGYGKSTLAAQWAARYQHNVAWVSVLPESNDLSHLLASLAAAVGSALPAPAEPPAPTIDAIVAALDGLSMTGHGLALVLDDYHHLENPDVQRAMDALVARLPSTVPLVVCSRTIPPLSLGRWRVEGRVRELTEADLRFTTAEAAAMAAAASRITRSQIARLTDRTDGWIAAIRLALIAIDQADPSQIDALIESFAENQWLDDYVVEEVLNGLPADVRDFVLRTANLGSLHPDLCDEVLGVGHSAACIDDVARRLVFVRRDGRTGASVTYHALFANCVARIAKRYLPAEELLDQHRRAARWFEQHGRPEAAVEHALMGEDLESAVRLAKPILRRLMKADWVHSTVRWSRKLPKRVVVADPFLAYCYVWSHLLTGQAREARQVLDRVDRTWMESENPVHQGYAVACRIYSRMLSGEGGTAELQELRHRGLTLFPDEYAVERLHLWGGIFVQESLRGNDDVANDAYLHAEACAARLPSEQNFWLSVHNFHRPNQVAIRGQLAVAIAMYDRALSQLPARLRHLEASFRHRLAVIHLERGDLDRARAEAALYEPDLANLRWEPWHPEAWIVSAQISRASGANETAYEQLERAISSTDAAGISHVAHHARALQASWWLADGRPELAVAWEQSTPDEQLDWGRTYGLQHGRLTHIQLRAAAGDFAAAAAVARELIAEAEQLKRWAEVIPFYAWDALAQFTLGHRDAALAALRAALRVGVPGGFIRSFTPGGADMRPLFAWAVEHVPANEAAYLRRLQYADAPASQQTVQEPHGDLAPALPDPLSDREVEVLELLHHGMVNREIAARLYIAERTVKKHVGNILTKLDVPNRTAAVIRARQIGLVTRDDQTSKVPPG